MPRPAGGWRTSHAGCFRSNSFGKQWLFPDEPLAVFEPGGEGKDLARTDRSGSDRAVQKAASIGHRDLALRYTQTHTHFSRHLQSFDQSRKSMRHQSSQESIRAGAPAGVRAPGATPKIVETIFASAGAAPV